MADLEIVHRRSFIWAWWLAGAALIAVLLWLAVTLLFPVSPELHEEETQRPEVSWEGSAELAPA